MYINNIHYAYTNPQLSQWDFLQMKPQIFPDTLRSSFPCETKICAKLSINLPRGTPWGEKIFPLCYLATV